MDDKIINSTAEINTGMTAVELKSKLVKDLPPMTDTEKDFAISGIEKYLINRGNPLYLILMRKEDGYITVFENLSLQPAGVAAKNIFEFLETEEPFKSQGINLVDPWGDHIEVWSDGKFYALFDGTGFIVNI